VIFLRKPLTAKKAFGVIELKEGVDSAWPGRGVLYFSRLEAKRSSSRMGKVVAKPEYKNKLSRLAWPSASADGGATVALKRGRAGSAGR